MQIDFAALEQALAPIEEIGQAEHTFQAGSTTITLRVLRPEEEVEATKYAMSAFDGSDEGDHQAVDYLDRLRIGFLSYSVVAVGSQDFRDLDFVTTGETLPNGVPVKIPRVEGMRRLLRRWSRPVLTSVFGHFHHLTAKAEAEAEQMVEYEPSNIPAEIERLEKKISDLRDQMDQADAAEKTKLSERLQAIQSVSVEEAQKKAQEAMQAEMDRRKTEDEVPTDPAQFQLPTRQPIQPQQAPPPAGIQGVPQGAQQPPAARAPQYPNASQVPYTPADESLIGGDSDQMNAAALAEHQRLLQRRAAMAQGRPMPSDGSALSMMRSGALPPHADAAALAERIEAERRATLEGDIDGVEVYRMGQQGLEKPQGRPDGAVLNPVQSGNRNPRFVAPKKP